MKEKTSKQWKCLRNALKIATKNIDAFIMFATIAQKVKLLSNHNTPYCSCFCCFVIIMSFVLIQQNAHCQIITTIEEYLTKMVIVDASFKMLNEYVMSIGDPLL
jgi:hypothetical protein